ncbi:MAG: class II aldolase/adducin family protein [Gammaproteobacteria bacterium]|nr:class II aldolase/adducin family protein [Gammaproteobacteria bacterium]
MQTITRKAVGGALATAPTFTNLADERLHRKQRLAAAFRLFSHAGFDEGIAGHITVRDPENPQHFWVNPFGVHFATLRVSDLVLVNHTGELIQGTHAVNGAAFAIHSRLHLARPDVVAAAHAHSIHGKAWASLGKPLDPISQDACAFFENHAVFNSFSGVVVNETEGDRIARALAQNNALILQNHGLLTVGASVDAAAYLFLSMERCCQVQLLAEAAGTPQLISTDIARETKHYIASDHSLWYSFQPLYDFIVGRYPDLLD